MGSYLARNPNIRIVWNELDEDAPLMLENLSTRDKYHVDSATIIDILDQADPWTPQAELQAYLESEYDISSESAEHLLSNIKDQELLLPKSSDTEKMQEKADRWAKAGWDEAYDFYTFVEDSPFMDCSDHEEAVARERERMKQFKEEEPVPPHKKSYPNAKKIPLPTALETQFSVPGGVFEPKELPDISIEEDAFGSFAQTMNGTSDSQSLSKETLGYLLDVTFGFIGECKTPIQGNFPLRTSPSGGSRHPTEAYPVITDWPEIPSGTYHYNPSENALEHLTNSGEWLECERNVSNLSFDPRMALVLTSVLERNMWKYRSAKTRQITLLDIGHLICTLELTVQALGLTVRVTRDIDEDLLSDQLGITSFEEPIYGVVLIGSG